MEVMCAHLRRPLRHAADIRYNNKCYRPVGHRCFAHIEKGVTDLSICYLDGKFAQLSECRLPVTDMAVQRGVAVFEAVRFYDRKLFAADLHLARLAESAKRAGIAAEKVLPLLPEIFSAGVKTEGCPDEGLVRPFITGGDVNDKGRFPEPRFFVIFGAITKTSEEERRRGAVLVPNRMERPYPLCKSTNYLFALIPLSSADRLNHETLYMPDGEITEAMTNNFFLCRGGKIITAPVGRVLDGVTRKVVLTLARENGFVIEERCPKVEELAGADEAFITGTVNELLSVVRVGDTTIGNGKPGPVAAHLYRLFLANIGRWLSD